MMPLIRRAALLAALVASPAVAAQTTGFALTPPTDPSARTLTVTGQGSAEASADEARLRLVVRTRGDSPDQALERHTAEVARISGLLAAAGVPDSSVVLDQFSIGSDGDDDLIEDAFGGTGGSGHSVVRVISATLRDLSAVPVLVRRLSADDRDPLAVQSRQIDVRYGVADTAPLRERALRSAMRDARRRGQLLADAGGIRLGRVLSVIEGGVTVALIAGSGPPPAFPGIGGFGPAGAATETASVVVVFAVE